MTTWSDRHKEAEEDGTLKEFHEFVLSEMPFASLCPICSERIQ